MPRKKTDPDPRFGESFSFGDVVQWTDATRSNLIWWTNTGIIKAEVEDTAGPGYPRRFSVLNVIEAQLAAHINRLKVPVKVLGLAVAGLRDLHDQCAAVWNAEPGVASRERLSDAQRAAVKEALIRGFQRRDIALGSEPASTKHYEKHVDWGVWLSADNERAILENAHAWRDFLTLAPSAKDNPYVVALFAEPDNEYTVVATLMPDVITAMQENVVAITVNLAPIVDYVRTVAGPSRFFKSLRVPYE